MNSTDYTECGDGVWSAGENCDDLLDDGIHGCASGYASGALSGFECTGGSATSVDNCTHFHLINFH